MLIRAGWNFIATLGLILGLAGRLQAAGPQFPPQDFPQVQPLLCAPAADTPEPPARSACQLESYTVVGADLKDDGTSTWLFYGPAVECGAHGNCPLTLLQKQGDKWKPLSSEPCPNENCLNFGNPTFSQVLKTSHQGLRDLSISSDSGSFFWLKDVYQWNGRQYLRKKGGTTYFFYDSDQDRLVQVSKTRYESCIKTGKNCL